MPTLPGYVSLSQCGGALSLLFPLELYAMPFLAPSFAGLPPLSFLLANQVEPRRRVARHLG